MKLLRAQLETVGIRAQTVYKARRMNGRLLSIPALLAALTASLVAQATAEAEPQVEDDSYHRPILRPVQLGFAGNFHLLHYWDLGDKKGWNSWRHLGAGLSLYGDMPFATHFSLAPSFERYFSQGDEYRLSLLGFSLGSALRYYLFEEARFDPYIGPRMHLHYGIKEESSATSRHFSISSGLEAGLDIHLSGLVIGLFYYADWYIFQAENFGGHLRYVPLVPGLRIGVKIWD